MPRSTASIDAQIAVLEAQLQTVQSLVASATAGGTILSNVDPAKLTSLLDKLYQQRDRISGASPMLVRGHVDGLH